MLSYVTNQHASANPTATGRIAISWIRYAPESNPPVSAATTPNFLTRLGGS